MRNRDGREARQAGDGERGGRGRRGTRTGAGREQRGMGSEAEEGERRKGMGGRARGESSGDGERGGRGRAAQWGTNETVKVKGVAAARGYRYYRARAFRLWRGKKGGSFAHRHTICSSHSTVKFVKTCKVNYSYDCNKTCM